MNNLELYLVGSHHPAKIVKVTDDYLNSPGTQRNIAELSQISGHAVETIMADMGYRDYLIVPDYSQPSKNYSPDELRGIARDFIKLAPFLNQDSFTDFLAKYGMLGIWGNSYPLTAVSNFIEKINYFRDSQSGTWFYEPLPLWQKHISIVRGLYKIYGDLINLKTWGYRSVNLSAKISPPKTDSLVGRYSEIGGYFWFHEGSYKTAEETALNRLIHPIQLSLSGAIDDDYTSYIKDESSNIGFRLKAVKSTPYLIAAIYYDLWRMINEQESADNCDFCGLPIVQKGVGRKKQFCDGACRVANLREKTKRLHNP